MCNFNVQTQYYCYGCSINKTDFPVVKVHVDELSSTQVWQHKVCATLTANVNINYVFPIRLYYRISTVRYIRIGKSKLKTHKVSKFNLRYVPNKR